MVHKHLPAPGALDASTQVHTSALTLDPLLKRPRVCELTTLSDAALTAAVTAGTFPAPVRTGVRAVAWRSSEVAGWLKNPVPIPAKARPTHDSRSLEGAPA